MAAGAFVTLGLALPAVLWPGALSAQQSGVQLTFGLTQRLEASENRALDSVSKGTTLQAVTGLSLGVASDTQSSSFRFNTSTNLSFTRNPDGSSDADLSTPRFSFSYGQSARNASFDVSGSYSESDIAFLRPLSDFLDSNGQVVLPTDLDDLTGTGLRRNSDLRARLSFGDAGPLGLTLRAGFANIDYVNASNASLVDNSRFDLGADLRLDINAVTSARIGTSWSRFEDADPATTDGVTRGLNAGLDITRPNGTLSTSLGIREKSGNSTLSFGVSRSLDLPRGTLQASLGLSSDDGGQARLNGGLRYSQQLPNGQLSLGINRSESVASDDTERLTTAINMAISHQLTSASSLSADFSYVDNEQLVTGTSIVTASLGLGYNRQVTRDWGLSAGYRHDLRDDGAGTRGNSDTVFLQLGRSFQFRP